MSYQSELRATVEAVAALVARAPLVEAADLDVAVVGHTALISLTRQVFNDAALARTAKPRVTIHDIDRHPVPHLGHLLERHPIIGTESVTAVMTRTPQTPAGHRWRDVARSAIGAEAEWRLAVTQAQPQADAAWSQVADVAVLAEAISVLDHDLARSLAAADRPVDAARARAAGNSGLAVAAREVGVLARTGDLPAAAAPFVGAGEVPDRILGKLAASDVPEAVRRAVRLLNTDVNAPPTAVVGVALAASRAAAAAGGSLTDDGSQALRSGLRSCATSLTRISRFLPSTAGLEPGNGRATFQSTEIATALGRMQDRGQTFTRSEALAVARAVADVPAQLVEVAERQLARQRWVVPQDRAGAATWGPGRTKEDAPRMLAGLDAAREHARHLHTLIPADRPYEVAPGVPPRTVLARALRDRTPPARPRHPSSPRHSPPRHR